MIRPADAPGAGGQRLVVGNGTTTKTWSAPDLAAHVTGPPTASIGARLTYRIDLSNPGDLPAKGVTAVVDVPDGLTYVNGNPAAEAAGRQLRWPLGDLGARQRRTIEIAFRAEKQGSAVVCCDVTAAGGLKVRDCATTTISLSAPAAPPTSRGAPALGVTVAPVQSTANVGDKVTFDIVVTNRTQAMVTGGTIRVRYDPGLAYAGKAKVKDVIDNDVRDLSPGGMQRFTLAMRVAAPGRLGLTVEASAPNSAPASAQAVVTAIGAAAVPVSVAITGPPKPPTIGDTARFTIDVTNTGGATLQNVQVVDRCDPALIPAKATDGWKIANGSLVWNIDSLVAGQAARFVVECTCQASSAKAYNRVTVALPDGGQTGGEVALEILPLPSARRGTDSDGIPDILKKERPPIPALPAMPALPAKPAGGGLSLSAAGLANPVHPGSQLTYEIRLTSKETVSYHQIVVTATVPANMLPIALGTVGAKIDGQVIRFDPVAELAPGKTLTYRAPVLAKQPGVYRLHVEMATPDLPKPMAVDSDETEVRN